MADDAAAAGAAGPGEQSSADDGPAPLTIRMDKRVDLAISVAVVALGVYICWIASGFRAGSFPDPVTSRGIPYFAGGFMILAGLYNIVRRLTTWTMLPGKFVVSEGSEDEEGHTSSAGRAFAIAGLGFAWTLFIRDVGYLILTPPIMIAMLWLMGVRSPWKLVGFPLVFTGFIWIVFSQVLKIVIPLGPLTVLFRAWGLVP